MHQAFDAEPHAAIGSEFGTHDFMEDNPYPSYAGMADLRPPVRTSVAFTPGYALGHSQRELKRLSTQAALFEPFTRRMFEQAGLTRGMRVLDVDSGNGDVAFLAEVRHGIVSFSFLEPRKDSNSHVCNVARENHDVV